MPTPHYKNEVQNGVIVWGREEAIKHRECALVNEALASYRVAERHAAVYLEEVLKVGGSKALQLRHIAGEAANGIPSKGGDQTESEIVGIVSVGW